MTNTDRHTDKHTDRSQGMGSWLEKPEHPGSSVFVNQGWTELQDYYIQLDEHGPYMDEQGSRVYGISLDPGGGFG